MSDPPKVREDFAFWNGVEARIAVLEERTKPKKKTAFEQLQAYGGLVALAISLIYTFPLGVWDKFIADPEKAERATIDGLRISLREIYRLSSEAARVAASTPDPTLRDQAVRGLQNEVILIITKSEAAFEQYRDKLLVEELISIALAYQSTWQFDSALKFWKYAESAPQKKRFSTFEIERQISKSYFMYPETKDIERGRKYYAVSLSKINKDKDHQSALQYIMLTSEWGIGEMMFGDWLCGQLNINKATEHLLRWQFVLNDNGTFRNMIGQAVSNQQQKPNQEAKGCS